MRNLRNFLGNHNDRYVLLERQEEERRLQEESVEITEKGGSNRTTLNDSSLGQPRKNVEA